MYYVSEKKIIINVYRFTLQELSTRIEEYDALKKSTLFQSMHKIIYDIKYYVYLKFWQPLVAIIEYVHVISWSIRVIVV